MPPDDSSRLAALTFLLQEVGTEIRSRRDPEHLYTAALVGALGAIAWGVATIATITDKQIPFWRHPALIGVLACVLMAWSVWCKVKREHEIYAELRLEQVRLVNLWVSVSGVQEKEIPPGLRIGSAAGRGHTYSGRIIGVSALVSSLFCLAVWLKSY